MKNLKWTFKVWLIRALVSSKAKLGPGGTDSPCFCPIPKWGASVLRGCLYRENCVRDGLTWFSLGSGKMNLDLVPSQKRLKSVDTVLPHSALVGCEHQPCSPAAPYVQPCSPDLCSPSRQIGSLDSFRSARLKKLLRGEETTERWRNYRSDEIIAVKKLVLMKTDPVSWIAAIRSVKCAMCSV